MVYIEMSSFENKQGVAQSLADEQKQTSIAEFFKQNKQMLGFGSKTRAIVTAVKEGVDNSLDAAEEAGILPDIRVDIEKKEQYYTVTIEDNGPGIPKDSMSSVFGKLLYGSRFHRRVQTRGQQGIGISAAVLYSQLTSGNPARITSKTEENEKADYIEMGIDTDNNNPVIKVEDKVEVEKDHGIKIELDMEGNMRGRKRLHNYIHQTAVVNPHATVELYDPKESLVYDERPVDELPEDVEEIKPHPHGVELGTLIDMLEQTGSRKLKSFFTQEFTRVGNKTAEGILNGFRDHYYGRSIAWKVLSDEVSEDDYEQAIRDSVRGKGEEATDVFMNLIYEQMKDSDTVSKAELKEIVSDSAEKASKKTDKQFASTVQENVVESVWNIIKKNIEFTIDKKVEDVTVDRKSDELIEMITDDLSSRFRQKYISEISRSKLEKVIKDVAEESVLEIDNSSFGDKAQDKVVTEIWDNSQSVNYDLPSISEVASDRDLAKSLLEGMRESDAMAPPTKCLSPITEEDIETGLKSRYDADFYTSCTRGAKVAEGDPFIIETGIAYGGQIDNEGQIDLNRFANRVPLVYQQGACSITKRIKSIRWNNYYRSGDSLSQNSGSLPQGPMVLMVHVASTSVPFTSESKDAVADVPQMEEEVERAVREVARDLKDHLKKERTRRERKQKEDVIGGLLEDMTDKIETVVDDEIDSKVESQARILNNLFVRKTGKKTIRVTNYGGRKYKVQIKINGERKRNLELDPNETQSTYIPDEIENYEVLNPEDQRVTNKT
jgi:DNA topoisomerase-6 subunit B